ncbi:hypothetical protein AAE021_10255 [Arthrobacter citreus]|uniref:Uncharacterized protein n=1 Tax=Arthrobacter citreus TaxID=1670 RepID=A0ABZ2ZR07_9MICC
MFETDFWVVVQTAALVTAGFGVWILARACWDYAGLPSVHDAYLQAVERRLRELDAVLPSRGLGFRAVLVGGDRPRGGSGGTPALDSGSAPSGSLGRKEAEYVRRTRRALRSRPSPAERAASQQALLRLLNRPALGAAGRPAVDEAVSGLMAAVAAAGTVGELAGTRKVLRASAGRLLRREIPRRFLVAFMPGMARYLDFVGRGSSLGLAVGVLLAGGLAGNANLVGALTSVCGVAGAVVFTLTVIRCESRSWPAGESGLWLRAARRYPQAFFLLRLALTTAAVLLAVYLVRT